MFAYAHFLKLFIYPITKKIILIIILLIITLVLSGLLVYKNRDNKENEKIVQTNKRDEYVTQIEITNEYINIRKENDSEAELLGKVYKGEIYTVLETKEDEYYNWCLIETSDGKKGYIAVKYEEESYANFLEVKEKEENTEE